MKKLIIIICGLAMMGVCFFMVLSLASEKTQKMDQKISEIHAASETAIGNYFKSSAIPPVTYPVSPIFYEQNECILVCFILAEDSGVKHKTEFKILLRRDNQVWKANIIEVKRMRYVPEDNKKMRL
jgi:hypothetical protein